LKHLPIKNLKQGLCASVGHGPLGASSNQKTSNLKHLQLKNSKQGQFKVVRENNGLCVQCTLPIYLPFSKIFKNLWSHAIGRLPPNSSNLSLCQIYLELSFILHTKFLLFFDGKTQSKKFQNTKTFFTSFEKRNTPF